jgi:thymidylate synthase (FAD)
MDDLLIRDDVFVKLVQNIGGDDSVIWAARVSTAPLEVDEKGGIVLPEAELAAKKSGLINYLVRERHGSPFEHNSMTFHIKAPIFVFREFMRHRVNSYNEWSGRYSELVCEFYIPNRDRGIVNAGKPSKPTLVAGTEEQYDIVEEELFKTYEASYASYRRMLDVGVAPEVARLALPVGIFSQMFVTMNARSIMAFLSLRTYHEEATFVSRPQREIEMVAEQIEAVFAEHFPLTYASFIKNGRVAP